MSGSLPYLCEIGVRYMGPSPHILLRIVCVVHVFLMPARLLERLVPNHLWTQSVLPVIDAVFFRSHGLGDTQCSCFLVMNDPSILMLSFGGVVMYTPCIDVYICTSCLGGGGGILHM